MWPKCERSWNLHFRYVLSWNRHVREPCCCRVLRGCWHCRTNVGCCWNDRHRTPDWFCSDLRRRVHAGCRVRCEQLCLGRWFCRHYVCQTNLRDDEPPSRGVRHRCGDACGRSRVQDGGCCGTSSSDDGSGNPRYDSSTYQTPNNGKRATNRASNPNTRANTSKPSEDPRTSRK